MQLDHVTSMQYSTCKNAALLAMAQGLADGVHQEVSCRF